MALVILERECKLLYCTVTVDFFKALGGTSVCFTVLKVYRAWSLTLSIDGTYQIQNCFYLCN